MTYVARAYRIINYSMLPAYLLAGLIIGIGRGWRFGWREWRRDCRAGEADYAEVTKPHAV